MKTGADIIKRPQKLNTEEEERCTIDFPKIEGDSKVYVGQTIVMLLRMAFQNDTIYSKEMQHQFIVELLAGILDELKVTPAEIQEAYNRLDNIDNMGKLDKLNK